MEAEEDEILTSNFTVAQLWQRLPVWLNEKTFGYLDIRQGNRLCSVSTEWKSSLMTLAHINRGIAFFQWPQNSEKYFQWTPTEVEKFLWKDLPLMKENTLNHVVFVEMTATRNLYGSTIIQDKLIPLPQPVSVITFYRSEIYASLLIHNLKQLLSGKSRMVRFVQCDFQPMIGWFPYIPANGEYHSYMSYDEMDEKLWYLGLKHPLRILTEETTKTVESNDDVYENDSSEPNLRKYTGWLLGEDSSDFRLIWPYPVEQLQWLEASLGTLSETVTAEVKSLIYSTYWKFFWPRQKCICLKNGSELPKMNLRWDNKDLDILDCAFFARLLSITPGVPKPPYELPDDM